MNRQSRSVCLIVQGLTVANRSLQPWRYISEVAIQLHRQGYTVTLLTEQGDCLDIINELEGVPIRHLKSVRSFFWEKNQELFEELSALRPNFIIWNVGLLSFLHQRFPPLEGCIQIGLFSAPIYSVRDLLRLGVIKLVKNLSLSGMHILGTLCPAWLLKWRAAQSSLACLVTQTETTRQSLLARFWDQSVNVIPPGVDALWFAACQANGQRRQSLGFAMEDFIVLYYGSPAPLRGLPGLIRAIAQARRSIPAIKLLVLSRRREGEMRREVLKTRRLVQALGLEKVVRWVDGFLEPDELVGMVSLCDLVALPFELVPSDAPLSLLEARAAQKPILTTNLACLPELIAEEGNIIVHPGDANALEKGLLTLMKKGTPEKKGFLFNAMDEKRIHRTWHWIGPEWDMLLDQLYFASMKQQET